MTQTDLTKAPCGSLRLVFLSNYLRRATRAGLTKVGENEVLSLNELYGQREGNDRDNVRKGVGNQLLQGPRCQEQLMIALYLCYLQ